MTKVGGKEKKDLFFLCLRQVYVDYIFAMLSSLKFEHYVVIAIINSNEFIITLAVILMAEINIVIYVCDLQNM